jgi:hypothetical protein
VFSGWFLCCSRFLGLCFAAFFAAVFVGVLAFLGLAAFGFTAFFGLTRPGIKPTIYHTQGEYASHYTTDVVSTFEYSRREIWKAITTSLLKSN